MLRAASLTNTGTITGSTVVIATTVLVNGLSDADVAPPVDSFAPATRANAAAAKADVLAYAPVGDAAAVSALSSAPLDAEATAGGLFHAPVAIAGEDRSGTSTTRTASGLGVTVTADTGLASLPAGYHTKTTRLAVDTTTAVASAVTGGTGLVLAAGRDATLTAADLVSGGDLTVTAGRDLALLAGADVSHTLASRSRTAIGLTAQVGQNVTGAIDDLQAAPHTAASGTGNDGYRAVGVALGATGSRRSIRSGWDPSFMQLR